MSRATVKMNITGLDGTIGVLNRLPAEVVSKRGGPVKLALAKGARKLRDEAKKNLRAAINSGPTTRSTGGLESRVIASRGKAPNGGKGERYLVRIKKKDYFNADGVRTNPLMTANLLEWGSSHQPATPWLRPAVMAHGDQIIDTMRDDLTRRIEQTVKQLAEQNRGKG